MITGYERVQIAPRTIPERSMVSWPRGRWGTARLAPFAMAGKVVANCCVGLGLPLTVTVGTPGAGLGLVPEGVVPEATIEKRGEVECITPCVEFMKMRK